MKAIVISLILLSAGLWAQVENTGHNNPYALVPTVYIDVANYKSAFEGKTKVDVFLKVPYSSIQFTKDSKGYKGGYSVTLTYYGEDEEEIKFETTWNEKVFVENYNTTTSKNSYNISYRTTSLNPGKYKLRCIIEDSDSKKNVTISAVANVPVFIDSVDLSDIVLVSKFLRDESGEKIVPHVSNIITNKDEKISFFYELYSDKDRSVFLEYQVMDEEDEQIYSQIVSEDIKQGTNIVHHHINNEKIALGNFKLMINVESEKGELIKNVVKKFRSKIFGFPNSITNLTSAISQMEYIANSNEIEFIQEGENFDDQLKRYLAYWNQKDPSPNTEENEVMLEYYRRIAYANEKFTNYKEGWKTDMGMIYVTLGPPNQVDRHPFDYDSKPYEIWDYYEINKRFIFVDQTGFGDYRLAQPVYGDWYRYRY